MFTLFMLLSDDSGVEKSPRSSFESRHGNSREAMNNYLILGAQVANN